jgi:hypothetical protein
MVQPKVEVEEGTSPAGTEHDVGNGASVGAVAEMTGSVARTNQDGLMIKDSPKLRFVVRIRFYSAFPALNSIIGYLTANRNHCRRRRDGIARPYDREECRWRFIERWGNREEW